MKFRFTGKYTNGHDSIDAGGIAFHGHELSEVPEDHDDLIRRLSNHPEFEKVGKKAEPSEPSIKELRAEYAEKFGKKPFAGWDADTLREKLA